MAAAPRARELPWARSSSGESCSRIVGPPSLCWTRSWYSAAWFSCGAVRPAPLALALALALAPPLSASARPPVKAPPSFQPSEL
jgi:hypothetical protein